MWQRLQTSLRFNWLLLGGAALCVLLLLAAVLQYRWINRVSEADQQLRHMLLETTLRSFQRDFDRKMRETLQFYQRTLGVAPGTDWEPRINTALNRWQQETTEARWVRAVSFATLDATGAPIFKRRAGNEAAFTTQAWPTDLLPYRKMLELRLRTRGGELPFTPRDLVQEFSEGNPVLVFQLVEDAMRQAELAAAPDGADRPGRPSQRNLEELLNSLAPAPAKLPQGRAELAGWVFLELDADYLQNQWLPEMLRRYFGQRGMEGYQMALLTGQPPRALYISNAEPVEAFNTADAALVLFTRRIQNAQEPRPNGPPPPPPWAIGENQPFNHGPPNDNPPPPERPSDNGPPRAGRRPRQEFTAFRAADDPAAWRLVVKDASGSVETAIAQARHRNLALALGMLLILTASFVLMLLAMQRARRLAAQQLEFVAGVSHELRTPLSVIQSTSHNLAQGLVKDPNRVQQYGAAIQTEVRRLSNQIEQMLAFAGIQAGRKLYDIRPVNLAQSCEHALAEYAATFAADDWKVECDVPADLPPLLADVQALESAIKNLLHNAQKYAAAGRWLSMRAMAHAQEVQLTIADHGPGIAAADVPHIFEPFYRSPRVVATTIPGAGLGLNLVQRHVQAMGGRVTVKTAEGVGTAFTLHLLIADQAIADQAIADQAITNQD
jgi:two-component system, OmpR family, sensor histidine kinase SenX3